MDNQTIQHLEQVHPRAAQLLRELEPEYRENLTITIPLEGGWPYFAVHFRDLDKIMVPADPKTYSICKELTQILREEETEDCMKAMEFASSVRRFGPERFGFDWQGNDKSDLVDSTAYRIDPDAPRLLDLNPGEYHEHN